MPSSQRSKIAIYQFSFGFAFGDAMSDEARVLKKILQDEGFKSEIYSHKIDKRVAKEAHSYNQCEIQDEDILIYHFTNHDPDVFEWFVQHENKKILIYHNVTPSRFIRDYDSKVAKRQDQARKQLQKNAEAFDLVLADSQFNAEDLMEIGYKKVEVFPLLYDSSRLLGGNTDKRLEKSLRKDHITNIMFLGRVAPNKRQDDLVKAFYFYNKYVNSLSRLHIVGSNNAFPTYTAEIESCISELGFNSLVKLTGHISEEEMRTYYANADLFVSMSEHEGFFVPAIECMYFELPMLLFDAGAIRGTVGDAAIFFSNKNYALVAEMMGIILSDVGVREQLKENGRKQVKKYRVSNNKMQFLTYIDQVIDEKKSKK